jgi:hypothetical protein
MGSLYDSHGGGVYHRHARRKPPALCLVGKVGRWSSCTARVLGGQMHGAQAEADVTGQRGSLLTELHRKNKDRVYPKVGFRKSI